MHIIKANITKRIQVEFIYSSVPQAKMIAVLEENIANNPQFSSETVASIRKCGSWMQDFTSGDVVMFDYNPTTQTNTIYINGSTRGSIQSKEFMDTIFAMYVGKYPATEVLKKGLQASKPSPIYLKIDYAFPIIVNSPQPIPLDQSHKILGIRDHTGKPDGFHGLSTETTNSV